VERLTRPDPRTVHVPESWSPDGEHLLFDVISDDNHSLWILSPKDRNTPPSPFGDVRSRNPISSTFAPNGRWVAYTSSDGRGNALFVQPYPTTGEKSSIATVNASHPIWSPDGKEIFYNPGPGRGLEAVRVTMQPTFSVGNPESVSSVVVLRSRSGAFPREITMTPDGRFVGVVAAQRSRSGAAETSQIQVVLNWQEELKRLVPTR
jgi:Tol biopolymer transport system component